MGEYRLQELWAFTVQMYFILTPLPGGYDTVISSETSTVSQGQMQLLTIARAMLTKSYNYDIRRSYFKCRYKNRSRNSKSFKKAYFM